MRAQFGPKELASLQAVQSKVMNTDLVKAMASYGLAYIDSTKGESSTLPSLITIDLMVVASIYIAITQIPHANVAAVLNNFYPGYNLSFLISLGIISQTNNQISLNREVLKPAPKPIHEMNLSHLFNNQVTPSTTTSSSAPQTDNNAAILAKSNAFLKKRKLEEQALATQTQANSQNQSTQTTVANHTPEEFKALQEQNTSLRNDIEEKEVRLDNAVQYIEHFSKKLKVAENGYCNLMKKNQALTSSLYGLFNPSANLLDKINHFVASNSNSAANQVLSSLFSELKRAVVNVTPLIGTPIIPQQQPQAQPQQPQTGEQKHLQHQLQHQQLMQRFHQQLQQQANQPSNTQQSKGYRR